MTGEPGTGSPKRARMSGSDRRRQILEAVRPVFVARGFAGARTKDLAEAAGVTEAVIYQHFDSKQALFEAAVVGPLEVLVDRLAATAERLGEIEGPNPKEALRGLQGELLDGMTDIAPLLGVALFSDQQTGRDFFSDSLRPLLDRIVEPLAANLEAAGSPFDPEIVTAMFLGTYHWLALCATFDSNNTVDPGASVIQVGDILYRGTAPPRKRPKKTSDG